MKLAIYDTYERKVSLTETLIWTGIFVFVALPLLWLLVSVLVWLYMWLFPPSVFSTFYLDELFRVRD